jgi:hypothetical protein
VKVKAWAVRLGNRYGEWWRLYAERATEIESGGASKAANFKETGQSINLCEGPSLSSYDPETNFRESPAYT